MKRLLLLAGFALPLAGARAQQLMDPTRPPAALLSPRVAGAVVADAAPALPRLQSVLASTHADGRQVAVIDGQTVRRGEKFKGAILASVSEGEVILMRGTHKQVLMLHPKAAPAQR
jgi:MSHA biogenesis protein MshK